MSLFVDDRAARAVFEASLPHGEGGGLAPSHTTWEQLGEESRQRYRRMARAAIEVGE